MPEAPRNCFAQEIDVETVRDPRDRPKPTRGNVTREWTTTPRRLLDRIRTADRQQVKSTCSESVKLSAEIKATSGSTRGAKATSINGIIRNTTPLHALHALPWSRLTPAPVPTGTGDRYDPNGSPQRRRTSVRVFSMTAHGEVRDRRLRSRIPVSSRRPRARVPSCSTSASAIEIRIAP